MTSGRQQLVRTLGISSFFFHYCKFTHSVSASLAAPLFSIRNATRPVVFVARCISIVTTVATFWALVSVLREAHSLSSRDYIPVKDERDDICGKHWQVNVER